MILYAFPANLRLDEDFLKTYWGRLSSSSSEDVFKTFLRRLPDVLARRLQHVSKTSSRRLAKTSSRRLQDIFETSCKDVFKKFSRPIIRLKCLPWSHFQEIYGQCKKFKSVIKDLSAAAYRGVFRTWSNIYKWAFLWKYLTALTCKLFSKKNLRRRCSTRLKTGVWLRVWNTVFTLGRSF